MYKFLIAIFFVVSGTLWGQNTSPFPDFSRSIHITATSDTLVSDSLSIVPNTVLIKSNNIELDSTDYRIANKYIILNEKPTTPLEVDISYRVYPIDFEKPFSTLDSSALVVDPTVDTLKYIGYSAAIPNSSSLSNILDLKGLQYNGNLARSISFGNTQDLVLNSNLNLRIQGIIGDSILLTAAISDDNIPLQPEGNTQQLREFDRIFIQLEKNQHKLIAGDYELGANNSSYFLRYLKKLQGLTGSTSFKFLDNKATYSTQLSGALSKGQFTRNEFNGIEGNQGPYTLVGAQGEQFIIVLAGTEKLFIDGARLERGFNKDYTIDYNSGEIIFTPNQLITQDKRIVVEFEYSTQEYTRSLVSWNNDISYKNWDINFQLYTEQDGRRPTSLSSLTDEQLNVLETIGDSTAFLPSLELFDPVNDSQLQSTYIQIDTTVNGVTFEDILFATKTGEPLFTARFSEVGFGKGDYLLNASSVNGRTYRWVAPINGVPQGNFEPRVQVAPPEQRQLAILGVNRKLGKNGNVKNEIALSNQDLNRFSDVNDDDNVGFANKFIFNNTWNTFPKKKIALETNFQHEFLSDNFNALNTFRTYEFNRDWNLSNEEAAIAKQENWVTLQNKVLFPLGNIGYSISGFLKDSIYEGLNQEISTVIDKKKFHLEASSSFLQSTNLSEETSFIRPEHDIYQSFPKLGNITLGFKSLGEYNRRTNIGLDTLNSFSNGFQQWDVYLKKAVSKELDFSINLQQRDNFLPVASDLETSTSSFNVSLLGNWRKKKSNLKWNLTYRDLKVNDQITTSIEDQETYLGRIQHQLSSKKNFIKLNTVYEIGGGQDQVLDFDFIEVPAGLGNFLWVDRNNNGIQEEEEFEIAPAFLSDSAQFIRVTNFTNDFVQTNDVDFIQSLNLNLSKLEKAPAFLKRFSTIIKGQIDRRTRASEEDLSVWNPFIFEIGESSLIRQTNSLRSTLFFNKSNKKYALDFGHLTSSNQRLQTTGFESQVNTTSFQRLRWNIHKNVILRNEFQSTRRENNSELSSTRNFLITGLNSAPELTLFISKKLRGNIGYEWKNDFNDIGNESLLQNSIDTEWTWNKSDKTNVRLSGSFIQADFEGTENTPVSFALLNGLQPGNNFLWNIDINKFLSKNIILNIRYEGRKTGENPIVHLGSMSVRASF